jgi:hypothetical protein
LLPNRPLHCALPTTQVRAVEWGRLVAWGRNLSRSRTPTRRPGWQARYFRSRPCRMGLFWRRLHLKQRGHVPLSRQGNPLASRGAIHHVAALLGDPSFWLIRTFLPSRTMSAISTTCAARKSACLARAYLSEKSQNVASSVLNSDLAAIRLPARRQSGHASHSRTTDATAS